MTDYLVDSSAFVKDYVEEPGSAVVRRARRGDIAATEADMLVAEFLADVRDTTDVVPLSDLLVDEALALVSLHVLRAYDAVQLATTFAVHRWRAGRRGSAVVLPSADRELNVAAAAEGLEVLDPTD